MSWALARYQIFLGVEATSLNKTKFSPHGASILEGLQTNQSTNQSIPKAELSNRMWGGAIL
jgi:hypothetical protein